jgi:hypothetical protein
MKKEAEGSKYRDRNVIDEGAAKLPEELNIRS